MIGEVDNQLQQARDNVSAIEGRILNTLKTIINALIDGINKIIKVPFNGINTALDKIKGISILGAKPFDFIKTINTPQIPKLAQGGLIRPNNPRMVIVGDNRREEEIVSPRSAIREEVINAIESLGVFGAFNNNPLQCLNQAIHKSRTVDIQIYNELICLQKEVQDEKMRARMAHDSLEFAGWNPHDISVKSMLIHKYFEHEHKDGGEININLG